MINIGDNVTYTDAYKSKRIGEIQEVSSDMDSYEEMRLKDGVPYYYSKKLTKFVPVKPKNMHTVYLTLKTIKGKTDYILFDDYFVSEE
jgi:hypothetical protein|tara:strand:- start:43 stop:306 length:264 start_codon:yes stop_codon:yes gene_type:complete